MKLTQILPLRFSILTLLMLTTATTAISAQTIVTSPTNGEQVGSPFNLSMDASTCSSKPVTAVGYSLDSSTSTSIFAAQSMNGPVSAPNGWHTVHVKVWNNAGGVCVTDVSVDVASGATSVIPSNAVKVSNIQSLSNWVNVHDAGTTGSSSGTMSMANAPSLTGAARLFANQFNDFGGQRFSVQFDDNNTSQNFFTMRGCTSRTTRMAFPISSSISTRPCPMGRR